MSIKRESFGGFIQNCISVQNVDSFMKKKHTLVGVFLYCKRKPFKITRISTMVCKHGWISTMEYKLGYIKLNFYICPNCLCSKVVENHPDHTARKFFRYHEIDKPYRTLRKHKSEYGTEL